MGSLALSWLTHWAKAPSGMLCDDSVHAAQCTGVASESVTIRDSARLGVDHVLAHHAERYPRFDPADLPAVDLAVLPDEPYRFTADEGPEAFPGLPAALVDGRFLTWYGPSLAEAPAALRAALP